MKANFIDSLIASTLKLISPKLASYYLTRDTTRRFVNYSLLYFVTYWTTVPLTVGFALGLGLTPLAWVLSGFFVGALVAGIRFIFSNYWIWKESKGQGESRGELPTTFTSPTATGTTQIDSSRPAPSNNQGTVTKCTTCDGIGVVGDVLCSRCRGHGKIRIVPRGSIPTIGGKSSTNIKIPGIGMMLTFIIFGLLVIVVGSKVPFIGNYIELGGIGIILVGVFMYSGVKKPTEPKPNAIST